MPYLADNSYLAIKPEATAGVAVIPTQFIPLVSSDIKVVLKHSADKRIKGIGWGSNDIVRGFRSIEGDVVVYGDPDVLGHAMNMLMAKGSTTGSGSVGYTHPFTVGDSKSYTFEIKKGLYAERIFGVKLDQLKFSFQDGQLILTQSIKAMGQFGVASVGVALTGAGMTSLTLSDVYDIAPNRGLLIGDVIVVGGVELTLTSVDSGGLAVGFSSTSVTAAIGAPVYLKPQAVSLLTLSEAFLMGNTLIGIDTTSSAADTAAASRTTAAKIYDFSVTFKNDLYNQNGTNRLDAVQILTKSKKATIQVKQLFESVTERQAFLERTKQAMTVIMHGKHIKTDYTTEENATLKFHNIKLIDNVHPLTVGDYIVDDQTFEVLYDNSDAVAVEATLINKTAGTVY